MNPNGSVNSTRLVEGQCIAARTLYPSIFENAAGGAVQSGLGKSYRREIASVPDAAEALLHNVRINSEVSDENALSLVLRTGKPINGEKTSFWISLNLDGDEGTGLDSGVIVPQGTHEGTDLIASFALDGDGIAIQSEYLKADGSSFAQLDLPAGGLQSRVDTVQAHVMTDSGCATHPGFDEISFDISDAVFLEMGHSEPVTAKTLDSLRIQVTTRSHIADGSEIIDTSRPGNQVDWIGGSPAAPKNNLSIIR